MSKITNDLHRTSRFCDQRGYHEMADQMRAVINSHDALVNALNFMLQLDTPDASSPAEKARQQFLKECPEFAAYIKTAREALKLAKGE